MSVAAAVAIAVGLLVLTQWRSADDAPVPVAADALPVVFTGGLSPEERSEFYHLPEGSEFFPVHWYFALADESGDGMFADRIERFGLIPDEVGPANPYGLPVGITAGETRDLRFAGVEMLGVTCAACHVSEMVHDGRRIRLDGAGAHADIAAFYIAIGQAVESTVKDPRRMLRFVDRLRERSPNEVLAAEESRHAAAIHEAGAEPGAPDAPAFDRALHDGAVRLLSAEADRPPFDLGANHALHAGEAADAAAREARAHFTEGLTAEALDPHVPTEPMGASRIGAAVENVDRAAHAYLRDAVTTLRLLKARLAFLHQMSARLNVKTTMPGLGRLDAFGGFRLVLFNEDPVPAPVGYPHLWTLEQAEWLHWDANTTSVLERNIGQSLGVGAVLDRGTYSSSVIIDNLDRLERLATRTRPPVWTEVIGPVDQAKADRGAALFETTCARCHTTSGFSQVLPPLDEVGTDRNRILSVEEPVGTSSLTDALADMLGRIKARAFEDGDFTPAEEAAFERNRPPKWRTTGRYVAGPLVGIWATSPYLHNNSVPTLDDLLKPPAERPVTFYAGSKEFDPVKVGYRTDERPGLFRFDTALAGNGNGGHAYGTTLPADDRAAIIEYLKTR